METQSSNLAWKIPWTEEPGGLQSMELQSQTQLSIHIHITGLYLCIFDTLLYLAFLSFN